MLGNKEALNAIETLDLFGYIMIYAVDSIKGQWDNSQYILNSGDLRTTLNYSMKYRKLVERAFKAWFAYKNIYGQN